MLRHQRMGLTSLRLASTLLSIGLLVPRAQAQVTAPSALDHKNQSLSVGSDVLRLQDDFAVGVRVSSPSFFQDTARVLLAGGVAWFPHAVDESGDQHWRTYGHFRLVFEAGHRVDDAPIRLYGFGGVLLLVLPDRLSSRSLAPGAIGGFGFEFYMARGGNDGPVSFLLEIGGSGTGATANHVPGEPSIGNGFFTAAGLRAYL